MKDVRLPGSARTTSVLGFGCASLFGGWRTRESLRLLDLAFETGYRHFDVAPAYGFGMAEEVLGKALQGRRDRVTLTSKVGIGPSRHGYLLLAARDALRPLKRLPLGHALGRKAYAAATPHGQFDIKSVRESLHASLISLRTDHLDLLLLHEVRCEQIDDELLSALSYFRRDGKILSLGIATSPGETNAIRMRFGSIFDVWQHAFDIFEKREAPFPSFTITHGSLQKAFVRLRSLFVEQPGVVRSFSEQIGVDAEDPVSLSCTLIGAGLAANPVGITLVGSRQTQRIADNAAVLNDARWLQAGAKLNQLLMSREGQTLLAAAPEAKSDHE